MSTQDYYQVMTTSKRRTLNHRWTKLNDPKKLNHSICERCHCESYYDPYFAKTIFTDRFGKIYYKRPECILPNTKM